MDNTNASKGINPLLIIGGLVVLALIGLGVFFMNSRNSSQVDVENESNQEEVADVSTPQPSSTTETASGSAEQTGEVKEFVLEAGSFYYKPNQIKVKQGDTVKFTINAVSMMHDFNIDELNVKIPVTASGKSNSVEFVASKAGTYEFYCSVGNHRQQGQTGTLIVEE